MKAQFGAIKWLSIALIFATNSALAGLILQSNWQYTTANSSQTSDASATFQPLIVENLLYSTSATASGIAKAFEDVSGGNNASVDLVYVFDFSVDSPIIIGLSDRLVGSLFLGDTDVARVDTRAIVINQTTNLTVASLPTRAHSKSGFEGTDSFDESAPFFQHLFWLDVGDYLLQSALNLNAHATSGVGDDRMESNFSYNVGMRWYAPEPSTLLLTIAGLAALCAARGNRKSRV